MKIKDVAKLILFDIKIVGRYAFVYMVDFMTFVIVSIEWLMTNAVCAVCGIEPRMPLSFNLLFKWLRFKGKLMGRYADEPDENLGGLTYDQWCDDVEEYIKSLFTRI